MPAEREGPDPDIPQDPGIPGTKTPEQLPPDDDPEVERVPDTGPPDVDDEGHMAPERPNRARRAEARKAGVEVTVSTRPKGTGEITLLPGVRRRPEREATIR